MARRGRQAAFPIVQHYEIRASDPSETPARALAKAADHVFTKPPTALAPLNKRSQHAASADKKRGACTHRCTSCNQPATNVVKLLCCDGDACEICHPGFLKSCPHCGHSAFPVADTQFKSSLPALIKSFESKEWANPFLLNAAESPAPSQALISQCADLSDRSSEPLSDEPRLLSLPGELQDIIFDFAYQPQPGIKYIDRKQWGNVERDRRRVDRDAYIPRPFPEAFVQSFTVSKAFFIAAARAWVGNQVIIADLTGAFLCFGLGGGGGIVAAFMTKMKTRLRATLRTDFQRYQHLTKLELTVSIDAFELLEPKFAWVDELDEDDLGSVMRTTGLLQLSGLQELTLVPSRCSWAGSAGEIRTWEANVRKLEVMAKRTVGKARKTSFITGTDPLLYPGSAVRFANPLITKPERSRSKPTAQTSQTKTAATAPDTSSQSSAESLRSTTDALVQQTAQLKLSEAIAPALLRFGAAASTQPTGDASSQVAPKHNSETSKQVLAMPDLVPWVQRQLQSVTIHAPANYPAAASAAYAHRWYRKATLTLTMKNSAFEIGKMIQQIRQADQTVPQSLILRLEQASRECQEADKKWNIMKQINDNIGKANSQAQPPMPIPNAPSPSPTASAASSPINTIVEKLDEMTRTNEAEVMQ